MIIRERGQDGEFNLYRGAVLVGHLFNTGAPKGQPCLQVYTPDYGEHAQFDAYEDVDQWILDHLEENVDEWYKRFAQEQGIKIPEPGLQRSGEESGRCTELRDPS